MNTLIPTSVKRKKGFDIYLPRGALEKELDERKKISAQTETSLFVYNYDQ
jgi:hypothetical protein